MKDYGNIAMRRQHDDYVEPTVSVGSEMMTPSQMRAAITEMARGRDVELFASAMVRNVMYYADNVGASGEDRYSVLAYIALRQLREVSQRLLQQTTLQEPKEQ